MKILTLVWSVGIGGGERAAVNYAIGYKQFGHDSKVLILGEGSERLADLLEANVESCLFITSQKTPDELFKEYRDWMPDIIHIHSFDESLLPYINQLKVSHTKVVETNIFSRPQYSKNYEIVSLSMQLSNWGYWKYTKWMKGARYIPQIAIVPNIVINNKFKKPDQALIDSFLNLNGIPRDAFVAGRLGQPISSKWDNKIIHVISQTVKPDNKIFYLFVGAPDDLKKELKTKSDFIRSRVKFIDKINGDENLSLYYHSLSCLAHIAKIGESFGYVITEALLCNIPVITLLTPLKDNAQFEIVGNNYGGFCVTNTTEFINALLKLYHHPQERNRLIKNNLNDWVNFRFSPEAVIQKQVSYYNHLLNEKTLPKIDVSKVIKDAFKLYGYKAMFIKFFSTIIHQKISYLLIKKIKAIV